MKREILHKHLLKSTRWAKWLLDNLDTEYENEEGEMDIDFNNVDILTKNYPSIYEVEGDESLRKENIEGLQ